MADGRIRNRKGFQQKIIFKGFSLDNGILPTDIDGVVEYHDKLWVFFEIKHKKAECTVGQRLFLERTADALDSIEGKRAVAYIAEHETPFGKDIDAASCMVRELRVGGIWRKPTRPVTLGEAIKFNLSHISD
jgi:hypothetical protein